MPQDDFDPLSGTSGNHADYWGQVKSGLFKQFSGERYSLELTIHDPVDDTDYTQSYGVGKDWDSIDGGRSIEHPGGLRAKFHGSTGYQDFINHVLKTDVADEVRARVRKYEGNRGPMYSDFWDGLWFYFEEVVRPGIRKEGDAWVDGTRVLPTKGSLSAPDGIGGQEDIPF